MKRPRAPLPASQARPHLKVRIIHKNGSPPNASPMLKMQDVDLVKKYDDDLVSTLWHVVALHQRPRRPAIRFEH
jgi:hypothetical protein